ncbi:MAG: glycosyl transferase [Cytophagales bacterium]|nr:MAG: glycosyl transferase [Cytophagales bacterium]
MKILYAIQATGNGHISRAREIIPHLQQFGALDLFVSGDNAQMTLPYPIKYQSKGFSIYYDKTGGLDYLKTFKNTKLKRLMNEVREFPIKDYDLIINDFEFISAYAARLKSKEIIGFGHQVAFHSLDTPRPKQKSYFGEMILKHYAPCQYGLGLHFDEFDSFIKKPIIRQEIRNLDAKNLGHHTIYLGHYEDSEVIKHLKRVKDAEFHLFSKTIKKPERYKNIKIFPINNELYLRSLAGCEGLITGAGFEAPAEAIFLGKKVMVIPIKGQYEQLCNAKAMKAIGVTVVKKISEKFSLRLSDWLQHAKPLQINYPNNTGQMIEDIFANKNLARIAPAENIFFKLGLKLW